MISTAKVGYIAALLSLLFILLELSRMQGNETTSYLDRPFLVSSGLGSWSSLQVQNRTLGVSTGTLVEPTNTYHAVREDLRYIASRANRQARWHESGCLVVQYLGGISTWYQWGRRVS